ncbi:MAG: ABC transporter permease subunit [Luteolibacter sp.]
MRAIGFLFTLLGSLAITGELKRIAFPTARWFFDTSRQVPWLKCTYDGQIIPWFGWVMAGLLVLAGLTMIVRSYTRGPANPVTARRIRRFCEIKRGLYSLILLLFLLLLAMLDQALVGKRALAVRYNDTWKFPAFLPVDLKNKDFGVDGPSADAPADYRKLKQSFGPDSRNLVIMPLIPYDPTGDTLPPRSRALEEREGLFYQGGSNEPFSGLVAKYYDIDASRMHLRYSMRKGQLSGPADGWDANGLPVYSAEFFEGKLISEKFNGTATKTAFLEQDTSPLRAVKYHPAPPIPDAQNWLGTTSQGYDTLAYLYGGLQVNLKAALLFMPAVYLIGIALGMSMGYFGGWYDTISQRLMEIFSNIPFLFVIIIFSSMVPDQFKGLPIILSILILFGWMGITALMRTAAYRDKERDYIAAARVLGASTPRIVFRHLLPNTVAILITLIPFSLSGLVFALTSLDYLGFGLPPEYATWGRLLNDGLANLSSPWLVSSSFVVLVGLLTLITFVGEAIREALDPKKFTYYR